MVIIDDRVQQSNELELLSRAQEGDASAFCELVEPLQTRLLRQAAVLSRDLSAAEDLASETLVEAWKSLPRYNETCRLSTWLYSILLHRHQKSVRRARARFVSLAWLPFFDAEKFRAEQQHIPSPDASPAEFAAQNDSFLRLRQCVDALSEKHRQIILLRFFEDASLTDMAGLLGCSVGTVKSRLHHALENLRKMKMNLPDAIGDKQL